MQMSHPFLRNLKWAIAWMGPGIHFTCIHLYHFLLTHKLWLRSKKLVNIRAFWPQSFHRAAGWMSRFRKCNSLFDLRFKSLLLMSSNRVFLNETAGAADADLKLRCNFAKKTAKPGPLYPDISLSPSFSCSLSLTLSLTISFSLALAVSPSLSFFCSLSLWLNLRLFLWLSL